MFEHLLEAVDDDYVRYITHVEATAPVLASNEDEGLEGALTNVDQVAPRARAREARPQRPLLVWLQAQIQAVPWPTIERRTRFDSPSLQSKNSRAVGWRRASI
jgi:hypothetical protein